MAKQAQNWSAFSLEFLGSLAYLLVLSTVPGGILASASTVFTSSAQLWLPFFLAASVIGSIALFFISFANLGNWNKIGVTRAALCATVAAGASLAVMTFGNVTYLSISLVGFVLAFVGAGLGYK
ncbi:MAG: hypothetical protein ACP5T4_00625 [Candidatus Micrarchaeia archaeon]